jgi:hypothetical protein
MSRVPSECGSIASITKTLVDASDAGHGSSSSCQTQSEESSGSRTKVKDKVWGMPAFYDDDDEDERMDCSEGESGTQRKKGFGEVVADGIKLINSDEVCVKQNSLRGNRGSWCPVFDNLPSLLARIQLAELIHLHSRTDVPSSLLFPWLHGIGDGPNGLEGGPLEEFFGSVPPYSSF